MQIPEILLAALIMVESGGISDAVGDNGKACGCLQIHAVYVEDVNRIYGTNYTHEDAFNCEAAKEITRLYLRHYGSTQRLGRPATLEDLARMHVAGPDGYKQECSKPYWGKVKKALEKLRAAQPFKFSDKTRAFFGLERLQ